CPGVCRPQGVQGGSGPLSPRVPGRGASTGTGACLGRLGAGGCDDARGGWVRRRLGRAGAKEATTMKGSMGIDHITLCVKNLAAAEYLFTKILGFDVIWSARDVGSEHSSMDTVVV